MAPHEVIARFKEQARTFGVVAGCTLTFPNTHPHPEILWAVHAALAPSAAERVVYEWHPGDVLELTGDDAGLLTESVQIGNYGPPEVRRTYTLRVGELYVWTCDDNDFDLVTTEISFRIGARSVAARAQVVALLVDWQAARGAMLLRRTTDVG